MIVGSQREALMAHGPARRTALRPAVLTLVAFALGCASCGGHSSASGPSGSDTAFLIQLNARFNDGLSGIEA